MRLSLLLAATAALCSAPRAQVSAVPVAGYDVDVHGPSLGLGAEARITSPRQPYTLSFRSSAEYVFAPDQPVVYVLAPSPGDPTSLRVGVLRAGADLIGRVQLPRLPVSQYVKVGIVAERTAVGTSFRETNLGAVAGLGVEARGVFVEGTVGTAAVSTSRVAVGVRF